jgi:endonuclease YncB( thermonuclease family)
MKRIGWLLFAAAFCVPLLRAGDAPDGTQFAHRVIAVDGPGVVRIRYCGIPVQVRLANVQFKGEQTEAEALAFLKSTLKFGVTVKIELESDAAAEDAPASAQVFAGTTHVNLELVRRGLAVSDARSQKYSAQFQSGQLEAMNKKLGVWAAAETAPAVAAAPKVEPRPPAPAAAPKTVTPAVETAPVQYAGPVVADLSSKEYHFPGSRYAQSIRAGARIEYKSPDEAERAGKAPSPFSFPDRARAVAARKSGGFGDSSKSIEDARKVLAEAQGYMREAQRVTKTNAAAANESYKKAARLLTDQLDRLIPLADAEPANKDLQKLTEDLSMSLYSCKKYQSL